MPSMSYCRFENTLNDLEICAEHINDELGSEREQDARKRLVEICQQIIDEADMGIVDGKKKGFESEER